MIKITVVYANGTSFTVGSVAEANKILDLLPPDANTTFTITGSDKVRWSKSKQRFVSLGEMHTKHIINALRSALRGTGSNDNILLLDELATRVQA